MDQEEKNELEAIRESTEKLLNRIDTLLGEDRPEGSGELGWWDTRTIVLAKVVMHGGVVSTEQWKEIGKELGFDPRGLGGFFTGKKPSMVSVAKNKKAVTESGQKDVEVWVEENPELAEKYHVDNIEGNLI